MLSSYFCIYIRRRLSIPAGCLRRKIIMKEGSGRQNEQGLSGTRFWEFILSEWSIFGLQPSPEGYGVHCPYDGIDDRRSRSPFARVHGH